MMSRVLTPMWGSSGLGSSAGSSRILSMDERFSRNNPSDAIRPERASSSSRETQQEEKQREEELPGADAAEPEEEEAQEHQHVVRRHEPQRSVPSVIDLFRLQPPASLAGDASSPVSAKADALSSSLSTSGNFAGSPYATAGQQQQQRPQPAETNYDVGRGQGGGAEASSDSHAGRWCFDAEGQPQQTMSSSLPASYTYFPALNSPPTAYRDGSGGTEAPTPPLPTAAPGPVSGGLISAFSRTNASDDDVASAAASPRGPQQRQQQQRRWQGGIHAEGAATAAAVVPPPSPPPVVAGYTREPLYNGGGGFDGSGSGHSAAIAAFQQQDLARHIREASTNTVDAGREGRVTFRGAVAGRWDGRGAADHSSTSSSRSEVCKIKHFFAGVPGSKQRLDGPLSESAAAGPLRYCCEKHAVCSFLLRMR